jgi:hypothetical protein
VAAAYAIASVAVAAALISFIGQSMSVAGAGGDAAPKADEWQREQAKQAAERAREAAKRACSEAGGEWEQYQCKYREHEDDD